MQTQDQQCLVTKGHKLVSCDQLVRETGVFISKLHRLELGEEEEEEDWSQTTARLGWEGPASNSHAELRSGRLMDDGCRDG